MHCLPLANFKRTSNFSGDDAPRIKFSVSGIVLCLHMCSLGCCNQVSRKCQYPHFLGATTFVSFGGQ